MRFPTNYRGLNLNEQAVVRQVFVGSVRHLDEVLLSNGVGDKDTPFTLNSDVAAFLGIKLPGEYVIFVGDAYVQSLHQKVRMPSRLYTYAELLVHEMTHVWQFQHGYAVIRNSLAHRLVQGEDMYDYNENIWLAWDDYNVEQQANIVEHWYRGGMKTWEEGEQRFSYISENIRGEKRDTGLPLAPPYHFDSTRPDPVRPAGSGGVVTDPLREIMAPRYRPGDSASLARVKRLEELFLKTSHPKALLSRLENRRPDDEGGRNFYFILDPATIDRLLKILRSRS